MTCGAGSSFRGTQPEGFCDLCEPDASVVFASIYRGDPPSRVVAETDNFLLNLDLSPIVRGHLLLMPKEHYLSMSQAIRAHLPEARSFVSSVRREYARLYGRCTIAEHGSSAESETASACIAHAHWHLLPFRDELRRVLDGDALSGRVPAATDWAALAGDAVATPYFFYWDELSVEHFEDPPLPMRQYTRSLVGRHLGLRDGEWDWAVATGRDALHATYKDVRGGRWC